jgi:hypothetical protein
MAIATEFNDAAVPLCIDQQRPCHAQLFADWKLKLNNFKLLMCMRHRHSQFTWSNPDLLSLGRRSELLIRNLDFIKHNQQFIANKTKRRRAIKPKRELDPKKKHRVNFKLPSLFTAAKATASNAKLSSEKQRSISRISKKKANTDKSHLSDPSANQKQVEASPLLTGSSNNSSAMSAKPVQAQSQTLDFDIYNSACLGSGSSSGGLYQSFYLNSGVSGSYDLTSTFVNTYPTVINTNCSYYSMFSVLPVQVGQSMVNSSQVASSSGQQGSAFGSGFQLLSGGEEQLQVSSSGELSVAENGSSYFLFK